MLGNILQCSVRKNKKRQMGWLYAKLGSLHFVLYLPKNGDTGLELVWAKLILTAVKWVGGYLWIREWLKAWIQLGLSLSSESSFLYLLSVSLTCVCVCTWTCLHLSLFQVLWLSAFSHTLSLPLAHWLSHYHYLIYKTHKIPYLYCKRGR